MTADAVAIIAELKDSRPGMTKNKPMSSRLPIIWAPIKATRTQTVNKAARAGLAEEFADIRHRH